MSLSSAVPFDGESLKLAAETIDDLRAGRRPSFQLYWFGLDRADRVAVFCDAGFGRVPRYILENRAEFLACFEDLAIKRRFSTEVDWEAESSNLDSNAFARKGFFCFDSGSKPTAVYRREASPVLSFTIRDVTARAAEHLKHLRMPHADFTLATSVDVEKSHAVV